MKKAEIATILSDMVLNLISDDVVNKKANIRERLDFYFFKKRVNNWLTDFCRKNDGTILTSGKFETYLKYHNPIEKIYEYVIQCNNECVTKDDLIDSLIEELKNSYDDTHTIAVTDELIIKSMLLHIYEDYNNYLCNRLTSNQRYMVATISNHQNVQNKEVIDAIGDVKKIITGTSKLSNPEEIARIYDILSMEIRKGNIVEVHDIMSFLGEKNTDIDVAIRIKLSLFSDYRCMDMDVIEALKQIKSYYIANDIVRYLTLFWFKEKDKLQRIIDLIRNSELKSVVQIICDDKKDMLMNIELEKNNHANVYSFSVSNLYNDEKWLVNRACAIWLTENAVINVHDVMRTLFGSDLGYVEELYILEKEQETILGTTASKKFKSDRLEEIKTILYRMKSKIIHNSYSIKAMYYRTLLRNQIMLCEEISDDALNEIPDNLKTNLEIASLIIQYKINTDKIKEDEVIKVCEKNGQYWLYCNYLIRNCKEPSRIKSTLKNHINILVKDIQLFLMYVQAIKICDGNNEAAKVMQKYENNYQDYIDYWIELIRLKSINEEVILHVYKKWEKGELKYINLNSELDFAQLLVGCGKYKEAMQIIKKMETLGQVSPVVLRLKAKILLEDNQLVTSLNILLDIFDDYSRDPFVVDNIIVISLNTQRDIPQKVIWAAIEMGTARLFMLVAIVYLRQNKKMEAKNYLLKALLRSSDDDIDVYSNYFMLYTRMPDESVRKISGVEENTAVFLKNDKGESVIYCIYGEEVLPYTPYFWQGATHMYRDQVNSVDFIRKKTGDRVTIDETEYTISEIMPVDCYLFRLCMTKLVKSNMMKQISIETKEDGNLDVEHLTRELMTYMPKDENAFNWLDNYKNLSNFPLPFFILQRGVRVNTVQFIMSLVKDKDIIIRELYGVDSVHGEKYILSFAATIILYMIGVETKLLNEKKVIIPESLKRTIKGMCSEIIDENDKEHVSAMGVVEDHLYLNVTSDEEKIEIIRCAAELKKFVNEINSCCNSREVYGMENDRIDLMDTFGISDYDALALAQTTHGVLVTGEVTIMSLIQIKEMNISGIGILNFLIELNTDVYELLDYMKKMVEYRFLISLTKESIYYILNQYNKIENQERKEAFMAKWIEYLSMAELIDENYKNVFAQNMLGVYQAVIKEKIDFLNPIWKNFVFFFMKYNNLRLGITQDENGDAHITLYREIV